MTSRPQVALATWRGFPELWEDDAVLLPVLRELGVDAAPAIWDDAGVDWTGFDLVVVRSTWDYVPRRAEFLAWARGLPAVANPPEVLAWTTEKTYLRELAAAGVPVVPTTWLRPGDDYSPPDGEHVVKPTVSANAADTSRYAAGEDSTPHVERLLADGRDVMVQPYLGRIDTQGETAVVFVDGEFSHAARKAPVLVPDLAEPEDVAITSCTPTDQELALARRAMAALPFAEPLLYARVDLVPGDDGDPVLLELELAEPSLFLTTAEGAAERLASAIAARVRPAGR